MTSLAETVIADAAQAAPEVPALQAAEAAAETVIDPSPSNILNDIETVLHIVKELKVKLAGTHPSLLELIKAML